MHGTRNAAPAHVARLALTGLLGLVSIRTMLLALIPFAALVALPGHGSPQTMMAYFSRIDPD
jgi:hypothetical protein